MYTFGGLIQQMQDLLIHLDKLDRLTTMLQTNNGLHNGLQLLLALRLNKKRIGINARKLIVHHTLAFQHRESSLYDPFASWFRKGCSVGQHEKGVRFVR
jgi:hypothetical protein